MRDLPDMYARNPRATGLRTNGIHIRLIMSTHVTSNVYHLQYSKNHPNLQFTALHIYTAMDSYCDYGIFILTFP